MTALPQHAAETPQQAARRLSVGAVRDGYQQKALHEYQHTDGTPAFWRIRMKHPETGDKWIRPMYLNESGEYVLGEPPAPASGKLLYNLPALLADAAAPVWVVEGESCADKLAELGLIVTTSGSADSVAAADWSPLKGRQVTIWPDNDAPGLKYAATVADKLRTLGYDVRQLAPETIEALPEHGDVVDWLKAHPEATADDVLTQMTVKPRPCEHKAEVAAFDADGRPRKQADILVDIGKSHTLFRDTGGEGFARIQMGDHAEVHPLASTPYRELLAQRYFEIVGKGCNRNALTDALTTLSAQARFNGETHQVYMRTAEASGDIVIDLGSPDWRVIRVTREGWRDEDGGAVMFRRAGKPQALPRPTQGEFERLWRYVNVQPDDRVLFAAFLLAALRPRGPFPALLLSGEQGTAKSTLCKLAKAIIDPSASPLRAPPKETRDLLVGALNSWLLCLDNLSYLPAQLSDALCRIATGGAISERTLYSNLDETLVEVHRPMIINGITELATRPDLAERGIHIELEPIKHRRTEAELWRAFKQDAPAIFAGLLDGLAMALRDVDKVEVGRLPRMADFALWAAAGLPALGFDRGEFMEAYRDNQDSGLSLGLESNAVGRALASFMETKDTWTGTATDLLHSLTPLADELILRTPAWPKSPRSLRGNINRLGPALRASGIRIEYSRGSSGERLMTLCKGPHQPSESPEPPKSDGLDANDGVSAPLHDTPPPSDADLAGWEALAEENEDDSAVEGEL